MKATTSSVFTLLVDNEFGVLTRITALIRREGWNIRSLAVAETKITEISRLTVCLECRHHTLEQVLERLKRLACVREVVVFSEESQVARELALIHMNPAQPSFVDELCEELGAQVLEREGGRAVLSVVCEQGKLDAMLPGLREKGLVEIARTGAISLRRIGGADEEEEKQ